MKVTTFSKFTVSVCAAALIVGAFAVPAQADPSNGTFGKLVGLGSDTTQDVMNGIAAVLPANAMASYDAIGSQSVTTRNGGTPTIRASGSGAGLNLLLVAIGQVPTATVARPATTQTDGTATATADNALGNIDFARSSSGAAADKISAQGVVTYVPFAKDAVSVAFDKDSAIAKIPHLVLGTSSDTTTASLWNIYHGDVRYVYLNADGTYNSVGKAEVGPTGTTANKIQALLPKSGSGTRSYFIGKVGLTETEVTTLKASGVLKDTYGASIPVEEHDGTAVDGDNSAIVPFSVSQWIAQANGVTTDRRHDVLLGSVNDSVPATPIAGGKYALNASYSAMVRSVFNIVPSNQVDDVNSDIAKTFVGTSSLVCSQSATIERYGFGLLTGTGNTATACGNTLTRAFVASESSTTFALSTASTTVGTGVTATANVVSTNNGGGTVQFKSGGVLVGIASIAKGATTAATTITPTSAGSLPITATFIPALAGVAASTSAAQTIIASAPVATAPGVTKSSVRISAVGTKPTVGKTLAIAITVGSPSAGAGTVKLQSGGTVLAKIAIKAGQGKVTVNFVPKTTAYKLTAYYTPAAGSNVSGSASATGNVRVAKATPVIKVAAIKSVSAKSKAKAVITVAAPGVVTAGTITIKQGSKVLVSKVAFKGNVAKITLPKLKKGNHTLTVIFNGSTTVNAATKTGIVVKIKK